MSEQLPKDPYILLSTINMKLRNHFSSPQRLCAYYHIELNDLDIAMQQIGYFYDKEQNQYRILD